MTKRRIRLSLSAIALAAIPAIVAAQQLTSQQRSVTDVRPRLIDEHDRPYFRETQSHRGWEVREPQFTVFAATTQDDARWAATQVSQAWGNASALADRWTQVHHNPDFGLSALQVAINSEPLRDRSAPLTTVTGVGLQTHVDLNVAPGQPTLQQQLVTLREGAAFAKLHTAGLDGVAPPWVVEGLASVAGRSGLSEEELRLAESAENRAQFGGQQWRYKRGAQDVLAYPPLDHAEAGQRVDFLLTGDDAAHAPAFLVALQQTTADVATAAAAGGAFKNLPGNPQPAASDTVLDQMLEGLQQPLSAWKENPLRGQPLFAPAANAAPELIAAEREMVVLLKLLQRFSMAPHAVATAPIGSGNVRTKIITFDRKNGARTESAKPRPVTSFAAFAARLTNPAEPLWATLDAGGGLLLSTDQERVSNLLALSEQRYSFDTIAGRTVLVRRMDDGQSVRGWLDENTQDKSRPIAKFEIVNLRSKQLSDRAANSENTSPVGRF